MRTTRPTRCLWSACLCLAAGCVATPDKTQTAGSFTSGGSGHYGQPVESEPRDSGWFGGFFSGAKPVKKIKAQTHLAHAQYEEALGNAAGVRKSFDEQRSNYAAARKAYEEVLAADQKSVDAVIGLARLDQVSGRIGDAEQGFLKAVRMDSNSPRALDALGQFYTDQRRWNDASATFQKALAAAPDDRAIRYHYGLALAKAGQLEEAHPQLVSAVGEAAAHYNLGIILHEQGDLVASEQAFEAALLQNPHLDQAQKWLKDVRREQTEQPRMARGTANPGRQPALVQRPAAIPARHPGVFQAPANGPAALPASAQVPATSAAPRRGIQQTATSPGGEPTALSHRSPAPVATY
jgi:Tfp pilus assembly protein PilF